MFMFLYYYTLEGFILLCIMYVFMRQCSGKVYSNYVLLYYGLWWFLYVVGFILRFLFAL